MSVKKREYLALSYFISRAFFLGVGFSFIYRSSGKDAWISILLGYLVGNVVIIIYDKIANKTNYNLNNFLNKNNFLSIIYKIIFFLIYLFFILYASVIFTNFVKVYYLFDTPIWATLLILYGAGLYASIKGEHAILRASFILFPISVALILLNGALLFPLTNVINFMPILTTSSSNLFVGSLVFALCSSFPNVLLLECKTTLKAKLISYAIVTFIILFINIFITGVLGEYLITSYSYPEYMVLRRIRFLDFIENVENFASIMWYFDSFIIISYSMCKIKKLLSAKKENIILPILLIALTIFSYIYFSHYFSILTSFLENGMLFMLIALILTCPVLYLIIKYSLKKRKIKSI